MFEDGLEEVGDAHDADVVAGVEVASHVHQRCLFAEVGDVGDQRYRGEVVAQFRHCFVGADEVDVVGLDLVAHADHVSAQDPVEGTGFSGASEAYHQDGLLLDFVDLTISSLQHSEQINVDLFHSI